MGTRSIQHPCSFFSPLGSEIRQTNVQNSEVCGPCLQNLQKRNLQGGDGYANLTNIKMLLILEYHMDNSWPTWCTSTQDTMFVHHGDCYFVGQCHDICEFWLNRTYHWIPAVPLPAAAQPVSLSVPRSEPGQLQVPLYHWKCCCRGGSVVIRIPKMGKYGKVISLDGSDDNEC